MKQWRTTPNVALALLFLSIAGCGRPDWHADDFSPWFDPETRRASPPLNASRFPRLALADSVIDADPDRPLRVALYADSHGNADVHPRLVASIRKRNPDLVVFAGDALNHLPVGHMPDMGAAALAVPAWPQYLRGHPEFSLLSILPFPALLHETILSPLGPPRDREGLRRFLETTAPLRLQDRVPFLFAPGNHDTYREEDRRAIARTFGSPLGVAGSSPDRLWFSVDLRNWRFIVLYSGTEVAFESHPLDEGGSQLEWLEAQLCETDDLGLGVVVAMHCPPFSSAKEDPSNPELEEHLVKSVLDRHRVDLVVSGHAHCYERLERRGVTYLISGGGGGVFDAPVPEDERDPRSVRMATGVNHFVMLELESGGGRGRAIPVGGGEPLDRFEFGAGR